MIPEKEAGAVDVTALATSQCSAFFYLFNSIIRAAFHLKLSSSCACPWVLKQTVDHNQYHLNLRKVASSFFPRVVLAAFSDGKDQGNDSWFSFCVIPEKRWYHVQMWLFFCLPHGVMSLLSGATFGQQDKLHNLITRRLAKRFAFKIA